MARWLGRKQIPPLPFETVLTDRSNGNYYRVTQSGSSPTATSVSPPIDETRYWVYEAFRGPTVLDESDKPHRLYVDGGKLGYEEL